MAESPDIADGSNTPPPMVDRSHTPPQTDKSHTPPPVDKSHTPPPVDKSHTPPQVDKSHTPPPVDKSHTPPLVDKSHTPPLVDKSHTPPPVDKSHTPPSVDKSHTPPPVDKSHTPPAVNGPSTPPLADTSHTPPLVSPQTPPITYHERDINLQSPCNYEALDAEIENEQPIQEVIETEEEISLRKKKRRFKKLIRLIVANKLWATEAVANQQDEHDGSFKTDCGEKLTFNKDSYKSNIQTCGELSKESIEILSKPYCMRSDKEIKIVQKILYRLKCFDRYSILVKKGLARVIDYDKFEDGRLIIKQGHTGDSFYFIVSGSVVVDRKEFDPFVGEYYIQRVGELTAGDCFGELALLHNTKRTASIRCRGTSEFLRVDKPDFDEVLRNCHQREWEIRINLLSSHPVFSGWTTRELKVANGHSKMKIYPPNSVMVSEAKRYADRVFFVASGLCIVVRRIDLIKRMVSKDKYRYILPPLQGSKKQDPSSSSDDRKLVKTAKYRRVPPSSNDKQKLMKIPEYPPSSSSDDKKLVKTPKYPRDIAETRFFQIAELNSNDYFNVGEDLEGLYVISVGRVEVVQVATLAFSRHSSGRLLDEMRCRYIKSLPTVQRAFENYVTGRRWESFKKNTVKRATGNRQEPYQVDPKEVPGVITCDQIYYCHDADVI